jgi:hypothetical protein
MLQQPPQPLVSMGQQVSRPTVPTDSKYAAQGMELLHLGRFNAAGFRCTATRWGPCRALAGMPPVACRSRADCDFKLSCNCACYSQQAVVELCNLQCL